MQVYLPEDPETPRLSSIACCWRVIVSKKVAVVVDRIVGPDRQLGPTLMTIYDHREMPFWTKGTTSASFESKGPLLGPDHR